MKVLELFAGNGDITKYLKDKGIDAVSLDIDKSKHPDICKDAYSLDDEWLKQFDFIWLSPDCTTYSLASHGRHRIKGGVPVSDYAKECDEKNTKLFQQLKRIGVPFICETQEGHFRNMPFVQDLAGITIYYSTYGTTYTKPTDLFSNCIPLLLQFDQTITRGTKHLDYCVGYGDFLGRCKMPIKLIKNIYSVVKLMEELEK